MTFKNFQQFFFVFNILNTKNTFLGLPFLEENIPNIFFFFFLDELKITLIKDLVNLKIRRLKCLESFEKSLKQRRKIIIFKKI